MWEMLSALLLMGGQILTIDYVPQNLIAFLYRPHLTLQNGKSLPEIDNLVTSLDKQGQSKTKQGIFIQSQNGELLGEYQAQIPLPAASLTKIATSLVALHRWGLYHRFRTRFTTNGQIRDGVLEGDLIVIGGGDPLFVWEDAIVVGNRLQGLGIKKITGKIIVNSQFAMNYEQDTKKSTELLTIALDRARWNQEVLAQFNNLPSNTPKPKITIEGKTRNFAVTATTNLLDHDSLPLWQIIKSMNVYSNNPMAEMLANQLGGPQALTRKAIELSGVSDQEIQLINGSGLGKANQISPRAVVAMLIAMQNLVQNSGFTIADLMPVAGCKCGTVAFRDLPQGAVVKTGTLDDVSSLAGIIQTKDKGVVWFAILNQGAGDLGIYHQAQFGLLTELHRRWQFQSFYRERPWQRAW